MTPDSPDHITPDNTNPQLERAIGLISALCDEQLTSAQARELETLVLGDVEIRSVYLRMMHLDAGLHHYASALGSLPDREFDLAEDSKNEPGGPGMDETMVLPAMNDPQDYNDGEFDERFRSSIVLPEVPRPQVKRTLPPWLTGGIAAALVLGVGLAAYVIFSSRTPILTQVPVPNNPATKTGTSVAVAPVGPPPPPPIPIATVALTSKAVWSGADMPPRDGVFAAGQVLAISTGDAQLTFRRGGRLVVEGPAEFKFVSDTRIELQSGKIVARIPGGGLVVACPSGSVTDLGTEFGVAVASDGGTQVAVFEGRVAASLNSSATTQPAKPLLLTVGQAAVMTTKAVSLDPTGAVPQRFVRSLTNEDINSLDVTDLISGGDGTTHRRGIGINPSTGAVGKLQPVFAINSDGKYHRTNGYPFIDGAFVADTTRGATTVDSAGDQFHFTGLGATSYNFIFTGGKIPWPEKPEPDTVLNGIDYSTPDHSIICIHPNNALTVDLNSVRRIYPDRTLKNFRCRVGISGTAKPKGPKIPDAAVVVLVDGSLRFQNPHFTIFDGSFEINVPLRQTDRFMTLVSTYAGPGNYRNWVLWVDTKLDLSVGH